MSRFNRDLVNNYVNLSDDKRFFYAATTAERMIDIMKAHNYTETEQTTMFYLMFNALCTASGRCAQPFDHKVFCYALQTDMSFYDFCARSREKYDPLNAKIAMAFAEKLGFDFQTEYKVLAICLFTCDGPLTSGEEEFLAKYFQFYLS